MKCLVLLVWLLVMPGLAVAWVELGNRNTDFFNPSSYSFLDAIWSRQRVFLREKSKSSLTLFSKNLGKFPCSNLDWSSYLCMLRWPGPQVPTSPQCLHVSKASTPHQKQVLVKSMGCQRCRYSACKLSLPLHVTGHNISPKYQVLCSLCNLG